MTKSKLPASVLNYILVTNLPAKSISELMAKVGDIGIEGRELVPGVFLIGAFNRSNPGNDVSKAVRALRGDYLVTSFESAATNDSAWRQKMSRAKSRVGYPSDADRYLVISTASPSQVKQVFSTTEVNGRQLVPGVYVVQPSSDQAAGFNDRIAELLKLMPGSALVCRTTNRMCSREGWCA